MPETKKVRYTLLRRVDQIIYRYSHLLQDYRSCRPMNVIEKDIETNISNRERKMPDEINDFQPLNNFIALLHSWQERVSMLHRWYF